MEHTHESEDRVKLTSKANIALIAFLLIAGYLLLTDHWAHVSGWFTNWPYVLLLVCPLMHLLMHGRHGGHGRDEQGSESVKGREEKK